MDDEAGRTSPIDTNTAYKQLVDRLNRDWLFGGAAPASGSLKHRGLYRIRRFLARLIGTQEHFNASVVQFVNTLNEAAGPVLGALDDVERHREALAARERRMEGEMARMRAEHEELRTALGVLRQSNHDLAREIERVRGGAAPVGAASTAVAATTDGTAASGGRRPEPQVRRLRRPVSRLARGDPRAAGAVCGPVHGRVRRAGRGLRPRRVPGAAGRSAGSARGASTSTSRWWRCAGRRGWRPRVQTRWRTCARSPRVHSVDCWPRRCVEHVDPGYLTNLLDAAWAALRPGSVVVFETINPACWFAFFESYIRDITHVRPLHPETLQYLLLASGFEHRGDPVPVALPRAREAAAGGGRVAGRRRGRAERERGKDQPAALHHLDYAAIARRA